MLQKLRKRMNEEKGFTLIELLVVVLIIGILAAIALPTFLGQREKAQDSSAKSDARNMVSQVESCFTKSETYAGCNTDAALGGPTGLNIGTGDGQVEVTPNGTVGYTIIGHSRGGNDFTITKSGTGTTRTCTSVDDGGCSGTGSW